ncbi:MAG: haloacid dehalogenase-like hydrolase [Nanoarchaeota archaeon]|nr:haloacid dehalogenase-like hydrolase [Nanoarchaeota archaeon]
MSNARVLDCDGTIVEKVEGTLLERLMRDFYKEQGLKRKMDFLLRYAIIKSYKSLSSSLGKIFGDDQITGETTSLELFDVLMLRRVEMPFSFVEKRAKEYSKLIKPHHIDAIRQCKDDIYIVSAEPVQLLEAIVREAGISKNIKKIYGTKFKIEDGVIQGFERINLFAGIRGKHLAMAEILSKGYSKVYAIGDSTADMGLFHAYEEVTPFTFHDSPGELKKYVLSRGGKVVMDLKEFFTHYNL